MKTLAHFVIGCLLSIPVMAQNTYPWPQTGNVGVNLGTSSPVNKFQIGLNNQGWNNNDFLVSNGNGGLAVHNDVGQTYLYGSQAITIRPGYGQMAIYAASTGNVGIRSTNPQGTFQVADYRPVIIKANGGSGVYGSEIGFNAVLNTSVVPNLFRKLGGTSQNGGAAIVVDYSGNMLFQMYDGGNEAESSVNYKPQVMFSNSGRVGFGTTSPNNNLEVFSNSFNRVSAIVGSDVQTGFQAKKTGTNATDWELYIPSTSTDFRFYNSNGGDVMTFRKNGDVGIGTTDPKGYKLAVAGKAIAEEVVVKLQTNWPDYVFEDSYKLRSLTDLSQYVKEHKHLPDVPTAAEVGENGLSLGEMNAILLKKVEELTLYVIELKHENDESKAAISIMEGQINRLKNGR